MYDVIENFYRLNGHIQLAIYEAARDDKTFLYYSDFDADELETVWSNAEDEPWSLIFPWRVKSTTNEGHTFSKYYVSSELLKYLKKMFVGEGVPENPYQNVEGGIEASVKTLSVPLYKEIAKANSKTIKLSGGVRNEALAHCFHSSHLLRLRGSVEFNEVNPLIGTNTFELSDEMLDYVVSHRQVDVPMSDG